MYVYVLNPGGKYCNYVFCGIGIGLIQVALGIILMVVICYCAVPDIAVDAHVLLCSFGFHFFLAEGLLSLHYANGWTAPMRLRHRKCAHVFLNACGTFCVIFGFVIVTMKKGISEKPHGMSGMIATILAIISAFLGPFAFFFSKSSRVPVIIHMTFGFLTFLMSSVCICLGITTESFQNWANEGIVIMTATLVGFYTMFIVISAFLKCVSRL